MNTRLLLKALSFLTSVVLVGCNVGDPGGGLQSDDNNTATENNASSMNNMTTPNCDLACEEGTCVLENGQAVCECNPGYGGGLCDACATGFQDNDGDGVCTENCLGLECGEFGQCDDTSGTRICVCDAHYAGDRCDECADGYQDNDGDGVCTESCDNAEATIDCGELGFCDDTTGAVSCTCPEGFEFDETVPECFLAVPLDPEIVEPAASSPWQTTGPVELDPSEAGFRSPGVARFGNDTCTMGGSLAQSYSLDSRDASGPIMVDIAWRAQCDFPPCGAAAPALRFGTAFQTVNAGDSRFDINREARVCLGEAGYGTDNLMEVVSASAPSSNACYSGFLDYVDHVEFLAATEAECPTPGSVFNGSFDEAAAPGTIPGWTLGTRGNYSVQVSGGDNALVMEPGMKCVGMSANTLLGIPAGSDAWALTYEAILDDGANGSMAIGGAGLASQVRIDHRGDSTPFTHSVCLPRWMNGTYVELDFDIYGQTGRCDETSSWRHVLDDVELVHAPDCGETGILRDGTFDVTTDSPWILDESLFSGSIVFLSEQGNRFVRMTGGECDMPSIQQSFIIPNAPGSANAIEFRFRHRGASGTNARATLADSVNETLPDTGGAWENTTICVPPILQGYPVSFMASMSSVGQCAPGNPLPVALDIDDVRLTTVANCEP